MALTPLRMSVQAVKRAAARVDLESIPPDRLQDPLSRADDLHRLGR